LQKYCARSYFQTWFLNLKNQRLYHHQTSSGIADKALPYAILHESTVKKWRHYLFLTRLMIKWVIIVKHEELYALYSSPNMIWVIKSRRLRWAGQDLWNVWGERRGAYRA
jgi:hypothetical protein